MCAASWARCPLGPASSSAPGLLGHVPGWVGQARRRWPPSCPISGCRARKGREWGSPGPGAPVGVRYPSIFVLLEAQAASRTHDVSSGAWAILEPALGGWGGGGVGFKGTFPPGSGSEKRLRVCGTENWPGGLSQNPLCSYSDVPLLSFLGMPGLWGHARAVWAGTPASSAPGFFQLFRHHLSIKKQLPPCQVSPRTRASLVAPICPISQGTNISRKQLRIGRGHQVCILPS